MLDVIFYLIFLGQIFLLSYHYPWKTYERILYVLEHCPPSEYPKLYPNTNYIDPTIPVRQSVKIFKTINIITILIGIGILLAAAIGGYKPDGHGEEVFVVFYAMVQFIPIMIMEVKSYQQNKLMRELSKSKVRKAQLQARNLFDYISPTAVAAAFIAFLLLILFQFYLVNFEFRMDKQFITLVGFGSVMQMFFGFLIYKAIYGKKQDPHLSYEDQKKAASIIVSSAVYTSIGMSIFFIINSAVKEFDLSYLDPVIMSLYFQALAFFGIGVIFREFKVEDVNFEVYKKEVDNNI